MLPTNSPLLTRFLGERVQLGFVVSDLNATMRYWTDTLRVGPFVVIEKSKGDRKIIYRGKETQVDWSLAFAYMGDVQIEFIHQTNGEPSPYKDFLDSGREGLHHIAFWPKDFEGACAHLEANNWTELSSIHTNSGIRSVVYYETPANLGMVIELVPMNVERTAYFSRIQRLSQKWDGVTRPVRRYVDRAAFLASGEGAE